MEPEINTDIDLRGALEWYSAMGVDLAVGDEPIDHFAAKKPEVTTPQQSSSVPAAIGAPLSAPASPQATPAQSHAQPASHNVEEAQELSSSAKSLEELRAVMENFDGCPLKHRATNLVFGEGKHDAQVMFVGEAPERDEDMQGQPFVGRTGDLLSRMLSSIGLNRENIFIANALPWRPPGNRNATPAETAVCLPFLNRQIELVAPDIIITLGGGSSKTLFNTTDGILRLRGKWRELEAGKHKCQAMATLHPAYLLKQPAQKALVWKDLLSLKAKIAEQK